MPFLSGQIFFSSRLNKENHAGSSKIAHFIDGNPVLHICDTLKKRGVAKMQRLFLGRFRGVGYICSSLHGGEYKQNV